MTQQVVEPCKLNTWRNEGEGEVRVALVGLQAGGYTWRYQAEQRSYQACKGLSVSSQAELGIRAFEQGRIAEAIVFLEFATKFDPENYAAWLMLAQAYQKDEQLQKAAESFQIILDNSLDQSLLAQAREGLTGLGGGQASGSGAAPSKCPACGMTFQEARPRCACGGNARAQAPVAHRIYLHDIQAYCRRRSVRLGVIFRGDMIVISAGEVRIQGLGTRTYPVNSRLLFASTNGMLTIERSELDKVLPKVNEEAMFRERNAGDDITMGKLYSWQQFLARLSEFRGYDVSTRPPDASLAGVLASFNALDQELINDALELREERETLGQTILRLGISNFEAMVSAVVGDYRITKPGSRPLNERLGAIMAAKDWLNADRLQEALALQPSLGRPLGEILTQHMKACDDSVLQQALKTQRAFNPVLPEADMVGELLVARKKITRTDMLQALADEQTKRRVPLGEVLINLGLITPQDLQSVLSWQSQKKRLTQLGVVRVGEILVNNRVITPEQLGETLMLQTVDPRPIGQLLVAHNICPPEQILNALEIQINRRNQMAGAEGLDLPPEFSSARRAVASKSTKVSLRASKSTARQPIAQQKNRSKSRKSTRRSRKAPPLWLWGVLLVLALGGMGYLLTQQFGQAPVGASRPARQ